MLRPRGTLLLAVSLVLPLSGCFEGDGEYLEGPFSVPAPVWEPGYAWTYDIEVETAIDGQDNQGNTFGGPAEADGPQTLSLEVLNTTEPFNGASAYYVSLVRDFGERYDDCQECDAYTPFGVFRQSDLRFLSSGFILAPLEGEPSWHVGPGDARPLPDWKFPLADGAAWTPGGSDAPFGSEARVVGRVRLSDGGQDQDGVHVRVAAAQSRFEADSFVDQASGVGTTDPTATLERGWLSFQYRGDFYWGISDRNLRRAEERTHITYEFEGTTPTGGAYRASGSMDLVQRSRLSDIDLDADAPQPVLGPFPYDDCCDLPVEPPDFVDEERERVEGLLPMNSFAGSPFNAANGSVIVSLALVSAADVTGCDPVCDVSALASRYDEDRFLTHWLVARGTDGTALLDADGAHPMLEVEKPGTYVARVTVHDADAGGEIVLDLWTAFSGYWRDSNRVAGSPGLTARRVVQEVPIELGDVAVSTTLSLVRGSPDAASDRGSFLLVNPAGQETVLWDSAGGSATEFFATWQPTMAGKHNIEWKPDFAVSVAGDDLAADSEVRYS